VVVAAESTRTLEDRPCRIHIWVHKATAASATISNQVNPHFSHSPANTDDYQSKITRKKPTLAFGLISVILIVYTVIISTIFLVALLWFSFTNTKVMTMVAHSPLGHYLEQLASGVKSARATQELGI
jgi:hypothetical protein